jgi:opacity protein-like surface antigen
MLNQNMAIGAEIGFNKLKNKNHNPKHHDEFHNHGEITSDIFHGMINFTQYFDSINSAIKPYASIGAGFARISAEGNLDFEIKNLIRNDSKKISISFSELEKFTFAYQFGLGFETISSKNVNFGVGYKYFATHGIETHDEDLKLNAQINSQQANQVNRIDFGSLKHQNHMLNLFVKFKI